MVGRAREQAGVGPGLSTGRITLHTHWAESGGSVDRSEWGSLDGTPRPELDLRAQTPKAGILGRIQAEYSSSQDPHQGAPTRGC